MADMSDQITRAEITDMFRDKLAQMFSDRSGTYWPAKFAVCDDGHEADPESPCYSKPLPPDRTITGLPDPEHIVAQKVLSIDDVQFVGNGAVSCQCYLTAADGTGVCSRIIILDNEDDPLAVATFPVEVLNAQKSFKHIVTFQF
ncbi:MAG: hypothetical protein KJ621_05525 [Proteobacteria bacterium]|nr:hypothetical protein [Pseudomonadota bacterium]